MQKSVTVVVPVYGDWESLSLCIESLFEHLDAKHTVLLVNDCGPDVDEIESNILKKIERHPNYYYHRNEYNLGFVGTCNRAVYEIDKTDNDILLLNSDTVVTDGFLNEMLTVLYLTDRHAITFPRSNNATIATIPFIKLFNDLKEEPEENYELFLKINKYLPRYSLTPTGVGFCLLIKRQIILNFGLFDTSYGLGYHEENDFCQRVNQYGYSAVMSNRAFVYHLESRSFTAEKKKMLNEKNEKTLLSKYPYYNSLVQRYIQHEIHPVDHFADVIGGVHNKYKILINLFHFPTAYNGTTQAGLSLLNYLKNTTFDKNIEFTIFAHKDSVLFHNLSSFGFRILTPQTIQNEVFNVGYCPSQIFHAENLIIMNRHCYKNIFSLLDIITLRCDYLRSNNYKLRSIFLDSLNLADKIVSISEFTKIDTELYFTDIDKKNIPKIVPIHMGFNDYDIEFKGNAEENVPAKVKKMLHKENYVLVFGNNFKHKAIDKVIDQAKIDKNRNYILLGPHQNDNLPINIAVLPSGELSNQLINRLLEKSKVILFPSQYEGFGFPILEAVKYRKPLVYFASDVGKEIVLMTKYRHAYPFTIFDDLIKSINDAWKLPPISGNLELRCLDDYNKDVMDVVINELRSDKPDIQQLEERWTNFARLSDYYYHSESKVRHSLKVKSVKLLQKKSPIMYSILRKEYRKRKF